MRHVRSIGLTDRRRLVGLLGTGMAALLMLTSAISRPPVSAQEARGVQYQSGWNIVAAPTGTEIKGATGLQYSAGTDGKGYMPVRAGEIIGGRAVWAYFPSSTTLPLEATASRSTRIIAPPGVWVLAGNPSAALTLTITGADAAMAYDTSRGYYAVSSLAPGQGAWVISFAGGDIVVGAAPTGPMAAEIRRLQAGLTQNAADVSNFGAIPPVATELIQAQQLSQVQSAMDDLRSAFQDGLVLENSAPLPAFTSAQASAVRAVRQNVALAEAAASTGDMPKSTQFVSEARRQAQTAEDLAATQARANGGTPPRSNSEGVPPPANLAIYGGLCVGATPALTLALAPSDAFLGLVVAALSGGPLPAAANGTPTPAPRSSSAPPTSLAFLNPRFA